MPTISNEVFFADNLTEINKRLTIVILCTNALCPIFIIFTHIKIFEISFKYSLIMECFLLTFSFIHWYLVYKTKHQKFATYFGLTGIAFIIAALGTHPHIGIYISYALVVLLSCLYFNTAITKSIIFICYTFMLASQFFRSINRIEEGLTSATLFKDWIAFSAGFTIEFCFLALITSYISSRCVKTLNELIDANERLEQTQLDVMNFIPQLLESHEIFTGNHVRHTVKYVDLIARELRNQGFYKDILDDETIQIYSAAANLHDIGKIHIPDYILNKEEKYTDEEFEMMRLHPEEGKKLIQSLPIIRDGDFNQIAQDMAYCHHEKFDGTGYPRGLKGFEIPLSARILAAADVLDALLSDRPYKKAFSIEKTLEILNASKNTHFEPCIIDAIIALKPIIFITSQEFKDNEMEKQQKELIWRNKLKGHCLHAETNCK